MKITPYQKAIAERLKRAHKIADGLIESEPQETLNASNINEVLVDLDSDNMEETRLIIRGVHVWVNKEQIMNLLINTK